MNLHKQTLTLDFPRQINSSNKCPQIDEVIKKTLSKQIHQHIRETHFGHQHALIQRTKILLKTSTDRDRYSTLDQQSKEIGPNQSRRCGTSAFQQRRDNRLNQTKRKLQILSQLHKKSGKDQIKRYREQIQQEQSQIKSAIAKYNLKRAYLSATAKPNKVRTIRQTIATSRYQDKEPVVKQDTKIDEGDIQIFNDKFQPYRRMLLNRRKSKGIVSPWTMSQPTQPN